MSSEYWLSQLQDYSIKLGLPLKWYEKEEQSVVSPSVGPLQAIDLAVLVHTLSEDELADQLLQYLGTKPNINVVLEWNSLYNLWKLGTVIKLEEWSYYENKVLSKKVTISMEGTLAQVVCELCEFLRHRNFPGAL